MAIYTYPYLWKLSKHERRALRRAARLAKKPVAALLRETVFPALVERFPELSVLRLARRSPGA